MITRRAVLAGASLIPVSVVGAATDSNEARRKALVAWALEDAGLEEAAGRKPLADSIRAGAESASGALSNPPTSLFTPIPKPESNPYLADALKRVVRYRDSPVRYPKGEAGNIVHSDAEGWRFINICTQALELTYALCHPQSPMAGDARLIAPMMRRFTTTYEYLTPGAKNLADFGISPWLAEMYYLLRSSYPGLILPAYQKSWERAIEVNAEAIVARYGQVFLEAKEGTAYPNAHTHYINALLFTSLILNRPEYRAIAESAVKLMATCQYPDGGNAYIGYQNECYTYHPIAVKDMLRYWQITGNQLAYKLAANTRWYFPLSVEPPGVAEYSTSPCWKPYWNQSMGTDGAAVVAALTRCPHNLRIVRENPPEGSFWISSFYRDDFAPIPAPDQYITHDRNIEGPRGRFGAWSFSGTARDFHDDPRGKLTYVGAMTLHRGNAPLQPGESPHWPLNAAFHAAGAEVRVKPDPSGLNRWNTHLCLARQERNASAVGSRFASVTTSHRLSVYGGPATDWAVKQQWLFTEKRIVGSISLEALSDQTALSIGGAIQLVSGRSNWGIRKAFEQPETNTFRYGTICVRFHSHDASAIETEYTDVMSGDTGKSGRIFLVDRASTEPKLYPKGTRASFLVEIHPAWELPALSVGPLSGIDGLEVKESGLLLQLAHNASSTERTLENPASGRRVLRSGQFYRAPWLGDASQPEPPAAQAIERIEPHSHIVLFQDL